MIVKNITTTLACLAMSCCVGIGSSYAAESFFASGTDNGINLSGDKVYPAGRIFPYAGFSAHSVAETKQKHFTMAGPAYGKAIKVMLEQAKENGMPILYPLDVIYQNKVLTKEDLAAENIDWEAIRADITRQVKEAAKNKSIAWWYLTPEELRWWIPNEIKYFEVAYKAIKAADPDNRPIWMYSPGHRNDQALAKEAPFQNIIGKGTYTNYSGQRDSRVWVRWSMEQEINAIKLSGNRDAIPILVPEMFQEPASEVKSLIPDWVRHDVYLGLVSGAKGVVIFSLWARPKFPSHQAYYDAYCQVASELNGKPGLGQVFLFGKPKSDLSMKIIAGQETAECKFKVKTVETFTYPAIAFANLEYGGNRYLIAVNSVNQPVTAEFAGFPIDGEMVAADAFTGKTVVPPVDGKLKLSFGPYGVIGFKFSPKGGVQK